ncbi:hypothetical protein EXN66_Car015300 [Channa argus]|uniref:Uncharacterized protein n=1 Tax=Channa argus TaxID=215402 RepID=A0A6G1QBA6_CHAAH|nr:hypothetical protein EXN66_Car015300 [Channa argus]
MAELLYRIALDRTGSVHHSLCLVKPVSFILCAPVLSTSQPKTKGHYYQSPLAGLSFTTDLDNVCNKHPQKASLHITSH